MTSVAASPQALRQQTVRGGLAKLGAQAVNAALRIGSLILMARLLTPADFGLVAMVTTAVGVLNLFRDLGLSTASIQRAEVSHEQLSTLFWINVLVGAVLSCMTAAAGPLISLFFKEPRLTSISFWFSISFLINALGIQHAALLQRQMRFTALAAIESLSLFISILVGLVMANAGAGYWSIVGATLAAPVIYSSAVWCITGWLPGRPRHDAGVTSMVKMGGMVTFNGLVIYLAYNFEKILLGRFWGADALGIYGRAYQLINIPTENLNAAVSPVALSTLSRVKGDRARLRSHFLKIYAVLVSLTFPITVTCALFADDIIFVMLGPHWSQAAPIFRLLAPTTLIFGLINPLWPLLVAEGLMGRSVKLSFVIAPLVIAAYAFGLRWGPTGVATAFSVAMSLWLVPHIMWCVHGTAVSFKDVAKCIARPLVAALVAAAVSGGLAFGLLQSPSPILRLSLGLTTMMATYLGLLLYCMGQWTVYSQIIRDLRGRLPSLSPAR
jgi:PST family polysaccharide transporter